MRTTAMVIAGSTLLFFAACKRDQSEETPAPGNPANVAEPTADHTGTAANEAAEPLPAAPPVPPAPAGLPETPAPSTNPTTPEKVELGRLLFFDTRLSDGGSFSCASCHVEEKGWTDGQPLSKKFNGELNTRHSPTLYNVAYCKEWYWDGRKATLEDQILAAWTGQVGATPDAIAGKLAAIPGYAQRFARAFQRGPTPSSIVKALAAYVRTLRSGNSPWDRYQAGDKAAVSDEVVKGFGVFAKSHCVVCHVPPLFTDAHYHNIGIGYKKDGDIDEGRGKVTGEKSQTGAFKTPTLRGVVHTAPYFHDGSVADLEKAIDFMLSGGVKNPHIDPNLKSVKLTENERAALSAFVRALSPEIKQSPPPALPPEK